MITVKDLWRTQGEFMQTCPVCSPHRKKKRDKCLGVKKEGDVIVYHCFHCGIKGKIQLGGENGISRICERQKTRARVVVRPRRNRVPAKR